MSDEIKLLTALCDALGFEVVVDRNYEPKEVSIEDWNRASLARDVHGMNMLGSGCGADRFIRERLEGARCITWLREPILTCKLVKVEG